ncbi:ROK family protein [Streptomyces sp. NPDC059785]|uniref:ROK family protein n=1 Tax=Streptomyces sp. NPDC059785 TaxID=3346945 RepID=UPI00364A2BDE
MNQALQAGLVVEGQPAPSTGGRPSRVLRIVPGRAVVLAAVFGATQVRAALADLDGTLLGEYRSAWDIDAGPDASLTALYEASAQLLVPEYEDRLWAVCVGVPGPVDFARGVAVQPPIMSGWDGFPLRDRLEDHFRVPAWVDNDANLMALGAWSEEHATSGEHVLLVKASTGIGLGLISGGRLHRGARGAAGDLGHTIVAEESRHRCRCGKYGCLEALAGGWALTRDARAAGLAGRSPFLADRLARPGTALSVEDVLDGCSEGDAVCVELVSRAGELIGAQLATLVSVLNPTTVFVSGLLARAGETLRGPLTEVVQRRSLPLATDELVITEVGLAGREGVMGAATLAVDELLHPELLGQWLPQGAPGSGVRHRLFNGSSASIM